MPNVVKLVLVVAIGLLISGTSYGTGCAAEGGIAPPECALDATKAAHPDWYRDGGYCELLDNGHQPNFVEPPCVH